MPDKKYILISMEDDGAKKIAEILRNKTCKKIIDLLAEKESSEKEISEKLNIPINTAEYNLKKLLDSELIEKTKDFFWSKKGKKIPVYKLSNKSIIISPKRKISSSIKSILPVAILTGIAALIIRQLTLPSIIRAKDFNVPSAVETLSGASAHVNESLPFLQQIPVWIWFVVGACFAIMVFQLLNLRKINKDERR
jgi:DNA-binding transcriptional ArsR family regulator